MPHVIRRSRLELTGAHNVPPWYQVWAGVPPFSLVREHMCGVPNGVPDRRENIRLSTSLAHWAIPADENGRPRRHDGRGGRVAILSFQTTVGRRFEHLTAKRDRRLPRRRRLESRLAAKNGRPTKSIFEANNWGRPFEHVAARKGRRGSYLFRFGLRFGGRVRRAGALEG